MLVPDTVLGYIFIIDVIPFISHNHLLGLLLYIYYMAGNELDTKDTTVGS